MSRRDVPVIFEEGVEYLPSSTMVCCAKPPRSGFGKSKPRGDGPERIRLHDAARKRDAGQCPRITIETEGTEEQGLYEREGVIESLEAEASRLFSELAQAKRHIAELAPLVAAAMVEMRTAT